MQRKKLPCSLPNANQLRNLLLAIGLLLCQPTGLLAQLTFTGLVTDTDGQPIEFATVYLAGESCGAVTNEAGKFSFTCATAASAERIVVVSFIGYATQQLAAAAFQTPQTISLSPASVSLQEVEVVDSRNRKTQKTQLAYPIKRPYFYYQTDVATNFQLASRIENPERVSGYLAEIEFTVGRAATTDIPVRLNFYTEDTACHCPGELLHQESIIVRLRNKKNKVDLTPFQVAIPADDFFVVFEWLPVAEKQEKNMDFSIGMIPHKSPYRMLQKTGGLSWQEITDKYMAHARILTELTVMTD